MRSCRARFSVAQIFNLPYRRTGLCGWSLDILSMSPAESLARPIRHLPAGPENSPAFQGWEGMGTPESRRDG